MFKVESLWPVCPFYFFLAMHFLYFLAHAYWSAADGTDEPLWSLDLLKVSSYG